MNRFILLLASLLIVFGLQSCEEYKPEAATSTITLKFDAIRNGNRFQMGRVFTDAYGNRVQANKFKNYISMVSLVADDGTEVLLKDFLLVDYKFDNEVKVEVPDGKYTSLKLGLGIPAEYNRDQDPASYPSSSPLSVAGSQDMFWQWSTGYIFAKFEGKADTTSGSTAPLLMNIAIHAGNDASFRAYQSPSFNLDLSKSTRTISVHLDVNKLFAPEVGNEVNLTNNAVTHSQNNSQLARDYMDNLVAALWVEL
jgi:hypothetical protein